MELVQVIRRVRSRWRLKLVLRGAAIVLGVGLAAFLVSAYGMERAGFSAGAITTFRIATYGVLAVLATLYLVVPLLRRVSDERVALYLEENEPTLEEALLSALEMKDGILEGERSDLSPALIERLIETAVARCRSVDGGRRVERRSLSRASGVLSGLAVAALLVFLLGPAYVRHGATALLFPFRSADAANPYSIGVEPGDVTIARGADQIVTARLQGFTGGNADVMMRSGSASEFERLPMIAAADSGAFEIVLFGLDEATEYFVQSGSVRSPLFHISVEDLPYVDRLELEYHFPAYTGLAPRTVDDGGDIAVLRGTMVRLRAFPTLPSPAGDLVLDGDSITSLVLQEDGSLTAEIQVNREGFYRLDLQGPNGQLVTASPQYTIDILMDLPPSVSFEKPGRDTRANAIEEVYVEARADDDYGVGQLELVYSVNGGEERTVSLFSSSRAQREVSAGHTFFLEEYELEPGDFVSYYARARDNNEIDGRQSVTSDIYFIQVRPFRKDFRQAEQQGSMGAPEGPEAALSETQREIIAGTFNLVRDRNQYSDEQFEEHARTLELAQGKLREQVVTLVQRLRNRGVAEPGSGFAKILEELPKATEAMEEAEGDLESLKPEDALSPEQRALQHLQRAEEIYRDVQVSFQADAGGGGGPSPSAEDLADLFELELDKLKNQYETLQRGQEQQVSEQIDETMERLKELARRQQQEAERQRQRAMQSQGGAGQAGGASQRDLAEETEETARQLERLARESRSRELQEAARRLQEAADAMRRSAAASGNAASAESAAAQERLEEARRLLDRNRSVGLDQGLESALQRAGELARQQRDIARQVGGLDQAGADRDERIRRLLERKDQMEAEIQNLEAQLDRMAAESRQEERGASRRLTEAANSIRDNKIREKVRYSKGVMQGRDPEYARGFEDEIASNLEELEEHIRDAQGAMGEDEEESLQESLGRTRDLVRGLESLDRRLQSRAEDGSEGSRAGGRPEDAQAQEGQRGAQGQQPGQPGAQDQPRAQRGQPEQGGQQRGQGGQPGQQPGQPGQQGQQPGQRGQAGDRVGPPGQAGGMGGSRPPPFSTEEARQFRSEYGQRLEEARELRRELLEQGIDVSDLDRVIQGMRRLEDQRIYGDVAEIERLRQSVIEGVRRFEFALLMELQGPGGEKLYLSGSDDVPEGFRTLIEEYYRALSAERERP